MNKIYDSECVSKKYSVLYSRLSYRSSDMVQFFILCVQNLGHEPGPGAVLDGSRLVVNVQIFSIFKTGCCLVLSWKFFSSKYSNILSIQDWVLFYLCPEFFFVFSWFQRTLSNAKQVSREAIIMYWNLLLPILYMNTCLAN